MSENLFLYTPSTIFLRNLSIGKIVKHWNNFWFQDGPPHALAIVRISLGLFLILYSWTYLPWWRLLLTNEGMAMPLLDSIWWFQAPTPMIALLLIAIYFVVVICFTVGWQYRIVSWLLVGLALYSWELHLHVFPTSYNRLLIFILFVMAWSRAGATFSLDAKQRGGSWKSWEPIPLWPHRLIAVQVTATYLGVGCLKLVFAPWHGGEILTYSYMGMWSTPLGFWLVQFNWPLYIHDFITEAVTAFEIALPIALWFRSLRPWFIVGVVLFHAFIGAFLSIWWFVAMYPLYILFWPPEEVASWFRSRS